MSTRENVNVNRSLELMDQEVHPENSEAIRDFIDHQAAEGIGELQQDRQVYSFRMVLKKFSPDGFRLRGATENELKKVIANINRSDYAESTMHKFRSTLKKFYKVENGGHKHPDKVRFIKTKRKKATTVTRDDIFTEDELQRLFRGFSSTRDRAFAMVLYESAARPGELFNRSISDFTSNEKGDFIFLEGLKNTPDRTNQIVRSGRPLREWLAHHPVGGELGSIEDPSAPMWVKTEQQACKHCGENPHFHDSEACDYEPKKVDRMKYAAYYRRFKRACERGNIPENKRRPYNLRHTRLTEVATFMGYEQLNKFAGWVPGSSRAKVYVHLNNDDVNRAIREQYGIENGNEEVKKTVDCPFCGTTNQSQHTECRTCGRPMSLKQTVETQKKLSLLERLEELENLIGDDRVLEELRQGSDAGPNASEPSHANQGASAMT